MSNSPKFADMKVEYVDHMGSDINVVNAARCSFAKEVKEFDLEKDTKLINYLAKHNHWSPLAHTSISIRLKAPIFMARQFVKHCVTGDTEVTFVKKSSGVSNGKRKQTIKALYDMWSGKVKYQGGNKGKRNVSHAHVRVFNETTKRFDVSHITDVLYQGEREVFSLSTESGEVVKITGNHQVYTKRGWVCVDDIVVNEDYLLSENGDGQPISTFEVRSNISEDVIARRELVKESCSVCGSIDSLEADHIVPVSKGGQHGPLNLQVLCNKCHKEKTKLEVTPKTTLVPVWTKVVGKVACGYEAVYDITVEGIHNFIANGLVVHNCVGLVWNEESRRYIDDEPEFYKPDVWRGKPEKVKQGSSQQTVDWLETEYWEGEPSDDYITTLSYCSDLYSAMIESGVAAEQARMILPQSVMTNWVWTGSLVAFARIVKLRTEEHAQKEAQDLAKMIEEVVAPLYPVSWKALMEHMKV